MGVNGGFARCGELDLIPCPVPVKASSCRRLSWFACYNLAAVKLRPTLPRCRCPPPILGPPHPYAPSGRHRKSANHVACSSSSLGVLICKHRGLWRSLSCMYVLPRPTFYSPMPCEVTYRVTLVTCASGDQHRSCVFGHLTHCQVCLYVFCHQNLLSTAATGLLVLCCGEAAESNALQVYELLRWGSAVRLFWRRTCNQMLTWMVKVSITT
ncbi:hypothetical protein V8C34DRAFT_185436 [Trichoderma compactum]